MTFQPNRLIIGLTGPSSTGKTTLCQDWCTQHPKMSFQSVQTGDVMAELGYKNHEDVMQQGELANRTLQTELIYRRGVQAKSFPGSYITDRTPLDSLVYYAVSNPHEVDQIARMEEFAFRCMKDYSAIVYTPFGSVPFVQNHLRLHSEYFHQLSDYTFRYFIERYNRMAEIDGIAPIVTLPVVLNQTREERETALQGLVYERHVHEDLLSV